MQNKSVTKFAFLIGALLTGGLLIYSRQDEPKSIQSLKPSQLDFSKSNQIQPVPQNYLDVRETANANVEKKIEAPPGLSETDRRAWIVLEEILNSKNDNDPRMDREFKNMTLEMHEALFKKYASLQMENRNGRGLIAFLVARDLKSPADAEFLRKIFQESPCTSFEDCKNVGNDDPHFSGINQTSLTYPQLASLYQLESKLEKGPEILKDPNMRDEIIALLKQAADFPVPVVQQKAEEIKSKYGL